MVATTEADGSKGSAVDLTMRDYLKRFQQRFGEPPSQLNMLVRGEGLGFIVRADSIIMTNAHAVINTDKVIGKLSDRREFVTKVLGNDKRTDSAVPKIEASDLPAVLLTAATPTVRWSICKARSSGLTLRFFSRRADAKACPLLFLWR